MKASYKFTQVDWKYFALFTFFLVLFYRVLQSYLDVGIAMLIAFGIGIALQFLLGRYFISVVEFKETYLQLKKGLKKQSVTIEYSELSKILYSYNRFLILQIDTETRKIKIPPPANLKKAKELFQWLATKNSAIEMNIIK